MLQNGRSVSVTSMGRMALHSYRFLVFRICGDGEFSSWVRSLVASTFDPSSWVVSVDGLVFHAS